MDGTAVINAQFDPWHLLVLAPLIRNGSSRISLKSGCVSHLCYEANHYDRGYDPLEINLTIDRETWLQQFALGAFCGDVDVCRRPTIAWLTGNIASGIAVYGDVRDIIWSISEGNRINTAMIGIGFIPGIGDVAGSASKTLRILPGLTGPATRAGRELLRHSSDDAAAFVSHMRTIEPDLVNRLEDLGTSSTGMVRLLVNNDPRHLERVLNNARLLPSPSYHAVGPPKFMDGGVEGENFMRRLLGLDPDLPEQAMFVGQTRPKNCSGCRIPDAKVTVDGEVFLHESKVGFVRGIFAKLQLQKDADLIIDGKADAAVWHFFASDRSGKIGPSKSLLDKMEQFAAAGADITYYIHLPS